MLCATKSTNPDCKKLNGEGDGHPGRGTNSTELVLNYYNIVQFSKMVYNLDYNIAFVNAER